MWEIECVSYDCEYYDEIERDHRDSSICRHPSNETIEDKLTCGFKGCPLKR